MSNGIEPVKIYNPLIGATGHVTTPEYILDEESGKTQAEINKEQAEINKTISQGGTKVTRITQYYAVHTSSTEAPADGFQEDGVTPVWIPIPNDNGWEMPVMTEAFPCLWNYELIEYSDLSTYESPRICISILPDVESGRGIHKIDYFYLVNNEPNITPEVDDPNWSVKSPATTNENRYLWEKQEIYFTDKPEELGKTVIRILGVRGEDGIDGVNIEYIFFLGKNESEKPENPTPSDWETNSDYQKSDYIPNPTKTDEEGNPTEDGNWRDNEVSVSEEFPYLWISKREYRDKKWGEFIDPTLWAKYGQDGNSILEIVKYYQVSSDSQNHPSGIEDTDIPLNPEDCGETLGGWTKQSPATTDAAKHLWCLEITYYTKLRRTYSFTLTGSKGDRGVDGSDIEYVYCCSPGKDIKPTNPFKPFESDENWKTNPIYQVDDYNPEPIVDGDYVWDWTDEPTDPSEEFPYEWVCERKKEKDENGDSYWDMYKGPYLWAKFGNDGAGLVSVKVAYLISDTSIYSDEIKGTPDTDHTDEENILEYLPNHWYNNSPAVDENYPYLWRRTTTIASQAIYDDPETVEDETKTDTSVLYEVIGSLGKKGIDGTSIDYIYTLTEAFTEPDSPQGINAPLDGSGIDDFGRTWYDDPQGVDEIYSYQWISTARSYTNELGNVVWTEYGKPSLWSHFGHDGDPGITPVATFKSTVFCRSNVIVNTPQGGNYDNPIPDTGSDIEGNPITWEDSIPQGAAKIWASSRIFYSDYSDPTAWSTPAEMSDTATFDVEFSDYTGVNPGTPDEPSEGASWYNYDEVSEKIIVWMATRVIENGVPGPWSVSKIKGEDGENGKGINIRGKYNTLSDFINDWAKETSEEDGSVTHWYSPEEKGGSAEDAYIVDVDLYVWDGDSWENVGRFQGEPGTSQYLHIKYANLGSETDGFSVMISGEHVYLKLTESNGEVPGNYIGTYVDSEEDDSLENLENYTWMLWKGQDGFGYEYIYKTTTEYIAPDIPGDLSQNDDFIPEGWKDNPISTSEDIPFCWMCYRQKIDGTWTAYQGDKETGKAALWSKFGIDGIEGNGIVRRDVYYLISESNIDDDIDGITDTDETERPSEFEPNTWYRVSPSVNETYKYLWKKSITVYLRDITGNIGGTNTETSIELIGTAGERGVDGLQIEWAFKLTKTPNRPDSTDSDWPTESVEGNSPFIDSETSQWTDDASEINKDWNYLWYITREKKSGEDWGPWGKLNESDGNYYASIYSMYEEFKHESTDIYYISTEENILPDIPSEAEYTTLGEYQDALKNTYGWKVSSEAPILTGKSGSKYLWKLSLLIYTGGVFEVDGPISSGNYAGSGAFKSFAFKRSQGKPSEKPTGGSYASPWPDNNGTGWTDGIPEGTLPLWSSTRIFSWDGNDPQESEWSDPVLMVDTHDLEILYCDNPSAQINSTAVSGGNPVYGNLSINYSINSTTISFSKSNTGEIDPDWLELANGCRWFDDSEGIDPIWMATSKYNNGTWSEWSLVKIKGEDGKDGENGVDGIDGQPGTPGENGSDAVSLYIDKPIVICGIDPETKKTLNTVSGKIKVKLMKGGKEVILDQLSNCPITINLVPRQDDSSSDEGEGGEGTGGNTTTTTTVANTTAAPYTQTLSIETETTAETELSTDDNCYYINLEIPEDQERTENLLEIEVTLKKTSEGLSASGVIQVVYVERGLVGPAGDKGPLLYPAGYWDTETEYIKTERTVPFVYIQETDKYYVLEANSSKGENPKDYPGVWEEIEKIKYLFTEALMANWAKLGEAVFWGKYMFSQDGTNKSGESADYSNYAETMFNESGHLSGEFTPNFFVDYKSGALSIGKLSETFKNIDFSLISESDKNAIRGGNKAKLEGKFELTFTSNHNISFEPKFNGGLNGDSDFGGGIPTVILPRGDEDGVLIEEGTHCTILHKFDTRWPAMSTSDRNSAVAVCADSRYFDPNFYDEYYEYSKEQKQWEDNDSRGNEKLLYNGFLIWRNYRVKFVFLAPGSMLKLRGVSATEYVEDSSSWKKKGLYWYIENPEEFEIMDTAIYAYADYERDLLEIEREENEGRGYVFTVSSDPSISHEGIPIIGSKNYNHYSSTHEDSEGTLEKGLGLPTRWVLSSTPITRGGSLTNSDIVNMYMIGIADGEVDKSQQ